MGRDLYIKMGAGIKIPSQKETYVQQRRVCPTLKHWKIDGQFCSQCGEKIIETQIEDERIMWVSDLIGNENLTNFFDGEITYLFSNLGHGQISIEEDQVLQIDLDLIQSMISLFEDKHSNDIQILEKKIGKKLKIDFFFLYNYH